MAEDLETGVQVGDDGVIAQLGSFKVDLVLYRLLLKSQIFQQCLRLLDKQINFLQCFFTQLNLSPNLNRFVKIARHLEEHISFFLKGGGLLDHV